MDALVTCMYNGLSGTRYGGRLNRDAMYRESLTTIARTDLPIFCFVPAADIAGHQAYFATCLGKITFVPLELHDVPRHHRIQRIKAQDPERYAQMAWQERCVEIMWGKFFMLERVLDLAPHAAHVYWIDAGLANANIISTKYIAESDLAAYRLSEVGAAFPPRLFARIGAFAGDRILVLKTPHGHNPPIPATYNTRPYTTPDALIAGLFGGRRQRVAQLCELFGEKAEAVLNDQVLYFEESILTGIYADHPELFETFTFDTWYHEGWAAFDPNQINFSNFFDLMLDTPAPHRIVKFPWNDPAAADRDVRARDSMITDEDIADLTLHHMGRTGLQPFVVAIGAMDGVSFDDFHGYIDMYRWRGLFVEPIPEQFRRLRENFAKLRHRPDNKYENSAIAEHDGTVQMLTINQDAVDTGEVHPCFGGMSAIYPPRNGLASAEDADTVARYGELIEVACLTLPTLFERHAIERVDLLCVDAEGWDYRIVRQLDFSAYRPKLIRCEYINLTAEEQSALEQFLLDNGYVIRIHGQNIDAVAAEYWQELTAERPTTNTAVAVRACPRQLTLVTALFDLSAGTSDLRLRHEFGLYLDHVKRLLTVPWPMVVFAQPELEEIVWRFRRPADTHLVARSLAELEAFPFSEQLRALGTHTAAQRPRLYHEFVLSKQFFLNDAAIYDPFDTDSFLWVDGDIAATIGDPAECFTDACDRTLSAILSGHQMLYVCRPLASAAEVAEFARSGLAALAGHEPAYLVDGRVFGGTQQAVNAMNGIYYSCLAQRLDAGHLGTEEHVLTIIAHTHRHLCTLELREAHEGLRELFAHWQHGVADQAAERA